MPIELYGIPHCSTVRRARAWLDRQQFAYQFRDLRITPPTSDLIRGWVASLGTKPLRNTSGRAYRALPTNKKNWTDEQWVDAFARDPMLLRRPIWAVGPSALAAGFREPLSERLQTALRDATP